MMVVVVLQFWYDFVQFFVFGDQCIDVCFGCCGYGFGQFVYVLGVDLYFEVQFGFGFVFFGYCYEVYVVVEVGEFEVMGGCEFGSCMLLGVEFLLQLWVGCVFDDGFVGYFQVCLDVVEFLVVVCCLVEVYEVEVDVGLWQFYVCLCVQVCEWFLQCVEFCDLYFCWVEGVYLCYEVDDVVVGVCFQCCVFDGCGICQYWFLDDVDWYFG